MMEVIYQRSMDFQEIRNHCGNQLYFQCMKLIRILYLKMLRHIQILWQNIGQFHSWSKMKLGMMLKIHIPHLRLWIMN